MTWQGTRLTSSQSLFFHDEVLREIGDRKIKARSLVCYSTTAEHGGWHLPNESYVRKTNQGRFGAPFIQIFRTVGRLKASILTGIYEGEIRNSNLDGAFTCRRLRATAIVGIHPRGGKQL